MFRKMYKFCPAACTYIDVNTGKIQLHCALIVLVGSKRYFLDNSCIMETLDVDEMYDYPVKYQNRVNFIYEFVYDDKLVRLKEPLALTDLKNFKITPGFPFIKDKISEIIDLKTLLLPVEIKIIKKQY